MKGLNVSKVSNKNTRTLPDRFLEPNLETNYYFRFWIKGMKIYHSQNS